MLVKLTLTLLAFLGMTVAAMAAESDFYRDVYPFLKANCISCHNKTTTKADLNMETPEDLKKGGESGPGIVPGKSAESLVVQASLHMNDLEMPPKNNKSGAVELTQAEISVLKKWIDEGAKSSVQQERQVVWQPLAVGVHPIYSVAMTKDGRFAACGRSNRVFVYDLATRQFMTQMVDDAQKSGTAHRALVQSLAFSPDGMRLASGSFREVKIWRQEPGKQTTRNADPTLGVVASVLASDGKQMVGANSTGALLMIEAATGKLGKKLESVNKAGIKLVSVSPDVAKAAVYGADATLSVWNLQDGKSVGTKAGVSGVYCMAWTPDAKAFITAGEDKVVRVWSLPSNGTAELATIQELKGAPAAIKSLVVPSMANRLITASENGKVLVWSVSEGKILREMTIPGVLTLNTTFDGKQLVTGSSDGVVRIWDVETGKQVIELRGSLTASQKMAGLDWITAAQGLEQVYQKTEVTQIEAQNKALDELLKKANETIVTMKKTLPQKQTAVKPAAEAKAAAQKVVDDVAALIAKVPASKRDEALEKQLKDAQEKLAAVAMTETSALAAAAAVESNIQDADDDVKRITKAISKNTDRLAVAKAAIGTAKATLDKVAVDLNAIKQAAAKAGAKPLAVAFSRDAQRVAAMFSDGTLNVWAAGSGIPMEQLAGKATNAASLIQGPQGNFIVCHADGTVSATGVASRWVTERVIDGAPFADRVNAVRFSPDSKTLATGGGEPSRSGDISLFDVASGKLIKSWKERHEDAVLSLDFSPNGRLLASGAADKIARVTEVATGRQTNLFEGHTHHVMGVAFRADGRVLATAGADGVVIAWDMLSGERKKKIEGWNKEVTSLQFIGSTNQIVTSAGDNRIRIVNDDGAEIRAMAGLPDFMQSVASTSSGGTIVGGGEDSQLRVWDGTSGKEVAVFGMK